MEKELSKSFEEPKIDIICIDDRQVIMTSGPRQFGDDWGSDADVIDSEFFG